MANFCEKCGSKIREGALFCASCGIKIENEADRSFNLNNAVGSNDKMVTESMKTTVPDEAPAQANVIDNINKKRIAWFKWFVAIFLLLVIVVTCTILYFVERGNIKTVVGNYVDAIYLGDTDVLEELYPDVYDDEIEKEVKSFIFTSEGLYKRRSTKMDNRFGDDIFVSFEIRDIKYVSPSVADLFLDKIEEKYGYKEVEIDSAYRVRFDVEIDGDDDTETYSQRMLAVKIDGQWYLYEMQYNSFAHIYAYLDILEFDAEN